MRVIATLMLALVLVQPTWTTVRSQSEPATNTNYEIIIKDVMIPMRDGIELNARLYLPLERNQPGPAILTLTPYTSDDAHERASFFARHGYVFVNANTRGRGGSEGESWPLEQDGPDGHDLVQWISQQQWCDGRVAMRGGSYRGMVQWQTMRESPRYSLISMPTCSASRPWLKRATRRAASCRSEASAVPSSNASGPLWVTGFRCVNCFL